MELVFLAPERERLEDRARPNNELDKHWMALVHADGHRTPEQVRLFESSQIFLALTKATG